MIVQLHGERAGDRAIGKPRTAAAASLRDPATAVGVAKQLLQAGAWRTVPKTGDDTDKAMYLLHAKVPAALAVLPRVAVAALTKIPPSPGCHWCSVAVQVAGSFGAETEPAPDELLLGFLGTPCAKCSQRHANAKSAAANLAQYQELVDEGVPPMVAGAFVNRPDEARARARLIKSLEHAGPPAPTGVMWPANRPQPASVTAALTAAARRRPPASAYYKPKPRPWPPDARRPR